MNTRILRKSLLLLFAGCLLSASLVALAAKPTSSTDRIRKLGGRLEFEASPKVLPRLPEKLAPLAEGTVVEFSPALGEIQPFRDQDGAVAARLFIVANSASPAIPEGEHYLWMGGSREAPQAALVGVKAGAAVPVLVYESAAAPGAIWELKNELVGELGQLRLWVRYCYKVGMPDASGVGYCVEIPTN